MKRTRNIHRDAELLRKALLDGIDKEEQSALEALDERPELKKVYEELRRHGELEKAFSEYKRYSWKDAYGRFARSVRRNPASGGRRRALRAWSYAAAACALVAVASFYLLSRGGGPENLPESAEAVSISPGSRQGMLALSDGDSISMRNKEVNMQVDGVRVTYKGGVLSYRADESGAKAAAEEDSALWKKPVSNQLIIPRGGENTVSLADGTTVHLNAGSKLTYPVRFVGRQRLVRLEGEGYFEVARDEERPFVVSTSQGSVTVLGTTFNVNAYPDAGECLTTLVSGEVLFSPAGGGRTVALSPGEQAVCSAEGVVKREVDVDEYIGWVKGVYIFTDKPLGEIMRTFEKWYDIEVSYESPSLRDLTYSGSLERDETINSFLDALELTGDIAYRINGRKVTIYKR